VEIVMSQNTSDIEFSNPDSLVVEVSSTENGLDYKKIYDAKKEIDHKFIDPLLPILFTPELNEEGFDADWKFMESQTSCCDDDPNDHIAHNAIWAAFGTRPQSIDEVCYSLLNDAPYKDVASGVISDYGAEQWITFGEWTDGPNDILKRHARSISYVKQVNPVEAFDFGLSPRGSVRFMDAVDLDQLIRCNSELVQLPYLVVNTYYHDPQMNMDTFLKPNIAGFHVYDAGDGCTRMIMRTYHPYLLLSKLTEEVVARIKNYFHVDFHDHNECEREAKKRKRWDTDELLEFLFKIAKCINVGKSFEGDTVFDKEHVFLPVIALPIQVLYMCKDTGANKKSRAQFNFLLTLPRYRWGEEAIFSAANSIIQKFVNIFYEHSNFPQKLRLEYG